MTPHKPLLQPTPHHLILFGLFVAIASWASLFILANHLQHFATVDVLYTLALLLAGGALLFLPMPPSLNRALSSTSFRLAAICLITVLDLVRYRTQSHKPNFSTAAPALIAPARELAHGRDPYLAHLQGGTPVSPGPGWVVLLAPLTLAGGVMLLTPVSLAVCSFLVSLHTELGAGIFLCLVLAQPVLLSVSFIGHDLFAIPIVFAILCLLVDRWRHRPAVLACLALLAGAFATSRLPMVILVGIIGLGLGRRSRRPATLFLTISLGITALLHTTFYLWARHDRIPYQPLHLFNRATGSSGQAMTALGLLGALSVAAWILLRLRNNARDWILAGGLFLLAAFIPVGLGELAHANWNVAAWEGSYYVSFASSLLVLALVLDASRRPT